MNEDNFIVRLKTRLKLCLLLLIATLFLQSNLQGQVVNVEKKRKGNKDGFSGLVEVGLNVVENNKHIVKFLNLIDLQYTKSNHTWIFLNDIKLMKINDDDIIDDGFQHLRYNYTFPKINFLTLEAFTQYQYNAVKQIKRRFLIGSGMRYRIVSNEKLTLFLGTLGMYEYEKRSNAKREVLETSRLASYVSIVWQILNNVHFKHINYYEPSFQDVRNYKFTSESSLVVAITSVLSLKISFDLSQDSHPSEGVDRLFYTWENALQFKF